ncbi:putative NAD-dependent malic enzyme 4 [[Clostridium] cellulosi]|jgi:Malic enzyme, NAD binding domain./Malic enzyme, N-terminal domain.|uniref:Putative NAD-dependent malic enzyme 4 n=1 Tax=[Clostridium] cellulosi TaxID=29343 RepID=A0A078KL42_9FIRM|nr:putative NAD-dependent malic enzyme 4 [[Clostridium] cellulosi]
MDIKEEALRKHYEWRGKIEITPTPKLENRNDLSLAYTPGVAQPCLEIKNNPDKSFELTRRWNMVAVVTDGTAVLGLGDIGPEAAMPVMEGKCVLFKRFAGVDAFPICIGSKDVDEIVRTVELISPSFGGINLEDISAPRCFEVERLLKERLQIPVFHDDQHGTAIIACAALTNALKIVGKDIKNIRVVINGAGAAGIAIGRLMLKLGVGDLVMCDKYGVVTKDNALNDAQLQMTEISNKSGITGTLSDALKGADAFVGVSRPGLVTSEMVRSMAKDPIIFALANPVPEIMPDEAKAGGAKVIGTGRSDFPNQINNVLAFPGVFKGALAVRARDITDGMKIAAAKALAALVDEKSLSEGIVIPEPFDSRIAQAVADAVADEAKKEGLARI